MIFFFLSLLLPNIFTSIKISKTHFMWYQRVIVKRVSGTCFNWHISAKLRTKKESYFHHWQQRGKKREMSLSSKHSLHIHLRLNIMFWAAPLITVIIHYEADLALWYQNDNRNLPHKPSEFVYISLYIHTEVTWHTAINNGNLRLSGCEKNFTKRMSLVNVSLNVFSKGIPWKYNSFEIGFPCCWVHDRDMMSPTLESENCEKQAFNYTGVKEEV